MLGVIVLISVLEGDISFIIKGLLLPENIFLLLTFILNLNIPVINPLSINILSGSICKLLSSVISKSVNCSSDNIMLLLRSYICNSTKSFSPKVLFIIFWSTNSELSVNSGRDII